MSEQMISVPDQSAVQEQLNKPALDVGTYLAVVTKVEPKENPIKGSYGLNWYVLINRNADSVTEGWDSEASVFPTQHYTYIGKKGPDGKIVAADNTFNLAKMLEAFELTGTFPPSAVMHRQLIVNVIHEPSLEDQEALKLDPTHEVQRLFPKIKSVRTYEVDGVKGPVLESMAEIAANTAPAGSSSGSGDF